MTLALKSKGIFRDAPPLQQLRAIAALFPEYVQIVVARDSGIEHLDDLRGKQVDLGLQASGTRVDALRILGEAGIRPTDFSSISEQGLQGAVSAMQEGKLDAFFATLQAPGRALQPLLASRKAKLLSLPPAIQAQVLQKHPDYRAVALPAKTYPGQEEATSTLGLTATLIAHQDLPAERVNQVLSGLFKSVPLLSKENLRASLLSPQNAHDRLSLPLHPEAQCYFSASAGQEPAGEAPDPPGG